MTKTWIDTRNGELLIGREAAADRIDEAGPDIQPLAEMLKAAEFPFKNGDFGPAEHVTWSREELIIFGKWIIGLCHEDTESSQPEFKRQYLERLHIFRLCPSMTVFRTRFNQKLWQYRQAIESDPGKIDGRYDGWSIGDYTAYASRVATLLERKPRKTDYQNAGGPSPSLITARFGGVGALNELIGYPNVHAMEEDDYIEWGMKVMEANKERDFTKNIVSILSLREQGPSASSIATIFGNFTNFSQLIQIRHETERQQKAALQHEKYEEYERLKHSAKLPDTAAKLTEAEAATFIARFRVIAAFLPRRPESVHIKLALETIPVNKTINHY